MTNEPNKDLVRRFWKAFETNDQTTLTEILSPDLVVQTPSVPNPMTRDMHLQGIAGFNKAFTDRQFTIDELIAEGNTVATRTTMQATHTGEFQGLPPTGQQMVATGLTIERIADGKIVERWFSFDVALALQKLSNIAV